MYENIIDNNSWNLKLRSKHVALQLKRKVLNSTVIVEWLRLQCHEKKEGITPSQLLYTGLVGNIKFQFGKVNRYQPNKQIKCLWPRVYSFSSNTFLIRMLSTYAFHLTLFKKILEFLNILNENIKILINIGLHTCGQKQIYSFSYRKQYNN